MINSIDFINKTTNDCFFKLIGPVNTKINTAGKIDKDMKPNKHYFSLKESLYPYLLVNVRSGSSYTIVESKDSYRRVPGSSIGGSFFVGVLRYLNLYTDPTVMVSSAAIGDSSKVDMSVGDIYGGGYQGLGLPGNMIASSFGGLKDIPSDEIMDTVQPSDIARSLLTMVAVNNLLYSKMFAQQEGIKRVVWIGAHVNMDEYMQMSEAGFAQITNQNAELIFPTYTSFLGSLGLLLT